MRTYSPQLVEQWKRALQKTFGYREYMDLLIQPTLTSHYLTYLPLLNYTDRVSGEIDDLLELAKDNHYLIRTLNPDYRDFKEYDPVTVRLDLRGVESVEEIPSLYRRAVKRGVRKERETGRYSIEIGLTPKMIDSFYSILQEIYHHHGTPVLPRELFHNLASELEEVEIALLKEGDEVIGSLFIFYDGKMATIQYGSVRYGKRTSFNGYLLYHLVIEHSFLRGQEIIDFGRSPYGVGTYFFKSRFGGSPIKIDLHTDRQKNIYRFYALPAKVWSHLPRAFTDRVGPLISKYLVDL
ncbi:MAG: GNAT family N-acetyltransferase [Epsilonproteobacteria bacterium]|nr:hypothetical protein [Campylobacterota bacterium]NPA57606.1 GNAT family N-acetyltransferase [Campylobacterota bacterium]